MKIFPDTIDLERYPQDEVATYPVTIIKLGGGSFEQRLLRGPRRRRWRIPADLLPDQFETLWNFYNDVRGNFEAFQITLPGGETVVARFDLPQGLTKRQIIRRWYEGEIILVEVLN